MGGTVEKLATFARAGVPTVARLKDDRLVAAHQHFPDDNDADFDKVAHFSPTKAALARTQRPRWRAPREA
jgi:hypothetical protein